MITDSYSDSGEPGFERIASPTCTWANGDDIETRFLAPEQIDAFIERAPALEPLPSYAHPMRPKP